MKTTRRGLFGLVAGLSVAALFWLGLFYYPWWTFPADITIRQFHIVGDVDVTGIRGVCAEGDQLTVWVAGRPGRLWICAADEVSWMRAFDVVADYGADPNGIADSTAAIQAAIDDATGTGGKIIFPRGTYTVGGNHEDRRKP